MRFKPAILQGAPSPFSTKRVGLSGLTFAQCVGELGRLVQLEDERRLRDLMQAANRANVSFYPVTATGLQVFDGRGVADKQTVLSRDQARGVVVGQSQTLFP